MIHRCVTFQRIKSPFFESRFNSFFNRIVGIIGTRLIPSFTNQLHGPQKGGVGGGRSWRSEEGANRRVGGKAIKVCTWWKGSCQSWRLRAERGGGSPHSGL